MKKYIVLLIVLLAVSCGYSQTLDDVGRMSINVQRPNNSSIPTEAIDQLEDKMHQIITSAGISDNSFNKRFSLVATVSVLKKNIINGLPARVSQTLEITFYIKDVIDNKEYGNASITSVGVDINENKAFIMAFSNVKPSNSRIQSMIEQSKELIIAYYRTNIDNIISDAYLLVRQGKYNDAIYKIAQVPDVCTDCTDKCRKSTLDIYKQKIDSEGMSLLQSAKAAWNAEPNANGAVKAAKYLAQINLFASCQPLADSLMSEMKAKVLDDDRKAWEFEQQQYADAKAREQRDFEFKVRQYEDREAKELLRHQEQMAREKQYHDEELVREQRNFEYEKHKFDSEHARDMAIIEASREVALEYAKNSNR